MSKIHGDLKWMLVKLREKIKKIIKKIIVSELYVKITAFFKEISGNCGEKLKNFE